MGSSTPDVIFVQPTGYDFPLWRKYIRDNRAQFGKVIVAFSESNMALSFTDFISRAMASDRVTFIPPSAPTGDWRNHSVNQALDLSNSSSVLFMEQDFIVKRPDIIASAMGVSDPVVFFREGSQARFHPAFLLCDRAAIDKTSRDFSAYPDRGLDHFGLFTLELMRQEIDAVSLEDLGFFQPWDWEHLAGVTYNYQLVIEGKPVTYQPGRFGEYNCEILELDVEQDPRFLAVIEKAARL